MQQVIIAIHLMVVTALVILVLYQKSEGGALGMGGSGVFTGRGQANALTRATGILATIFFITSIALTVLPAWERRREGGDDWTKSLEQGTIQLKELPKGEGKTDGKGKQGAPEQAPEPGKESIFDQLQRAQQQRQQRSGPAATPPAAEAPAPAQQPPAVEAPKAAAPAEAPKAEAPKPDVTAPAPKSEAPAAPAERAPESKPVEAKPAESEVKPAAPEAKPAAPETKPAEPENKPAPPTIWKAPTQ